MFAFFRSLNYPNAPITEMKPASAGTYAVGQALVLSGGALATASGTTAPAYISAFAGTVAAGVKIPVTPVNGQQWKVPVSAAPTALNAGDKVTIGSDGLTVTATTTSGVAKIVDKLSAAASGDDVLVQF